MEETAFLSARVPEGTKRRIKEIAARRGTTIQNLMRDLVEEVIQREDSRRPELARVIAALRKQRKPLRAMGVEHLDLFGSVARNEANEKSDIDIAVQFSTKKALSLGQFASIRQLLEDILRHPVDLSESARLNDSVARGYREDAIRVF